MRRIRMMTLTCTLLALVDSVFAATSDGLLVWNTFLGGTSNGEAYSVAVDRSGNVYVAGVSDGSWGSPIRGYTARWDVVIAKLGSDGSVAWSTFLGGVDDDYADGIDVSEEGEVYVVGTSESGWGAPIRAYSADSDVFAAKLASDGALIWSTFLGGSSDDFAGDIARTPAGALCVTGSSYGSWGSPIRGYSAAGDAFAAKLEGDGSLTWNTFLGGGGSESGASVAVDPSTGNAFIAGPSSMSWGVPVRPFAASYDAFVARLGSDGSLTWNTFLGGGGSDAAYGIDVDASGTSYLVGHSQATWGSPIRAYSGAQDMLVASVAADGSLIWNTFLGGSGIEFGGGEIALDPDRNVCVAASTNASWGSPVRPFAASEDGWAAKLTSSGSLLWNTFVGGSDDDPAYGMAVDECGNIYLAGDSYATWGNPVSPFTLGVENIYVAKVASSGCPILTSIKSKKSKPGTRATLYGLNFSSSKSKNMVYFGKYKATVSKATTTKLRVTIPSKCKAGVVDVTESVNSIESNAVSFQIK